MPKLVVITGPSGVGKGTLIGRMLDSLDGIVMSTSATTRQPRPGEVDGREYHFLSRDEFRSRIDAGEFLEWAEYAGNLYGTPVSEVQGRDPSVRGVVLEIEVLGAEQIKAKDPDAILIFIAPPTVGDLATRLVGRGTDSAEQVQLRLAQAEREMAAVDRFDTVIINDDPATASDQLVDEVRRRLD